MRLTNYDMLPVVWPSQIKKGFGYRELADRYAAMEKQPLLVTGAILTGYIPSESDGAIHLDGLLSAAVLTSHPCPADYKKGAALIPLPLEILWLSKDGWPLWAASDLIPDDQTSKSQEYWHKRYPTHRAELGTKLSAKTSAGRWREYRVPVTAIVTGAIKGVCIGNKEEVERLLKFVTHVGKKGAAGYGRVEWQVREFPDSAMALDAIHRTKATPIDYAAQKGLAGKVKPLSGWTPPYWYAPNHLPCLVGGDQ